MAKPKPAPNIDKDIAPFWEGVEAQRFLLVRCQDCGTWYWPFAYCRKCPAKAFASNMAWEEASGLGTVFAFNVHQIVFDPAFQDDVPYVYAMIELDEGPMFGTNIVNCDVHDVRVGDRVRIIFEHNEEGGFTLPKAEPVAQTGERPAMQIQSSR